MGNGRVGQDAMAEVEDVRPVGEDHAQRIDTRIERIAAVERNILRLGIHELVLADVPPKVAIDEAVQLAHWFGGAKAPAFVNGVLDRVAKQLGRL